MKKEIHTRANGTFCIGHVNDHNAVEIFFDDLRGENNYLQLRKNEVDYTPIPITLNSWIPTNTYTSNDDGSPFSYEAQILEKVDGKYIAHSNVFKMYFSESLGADTLDKEDVPPVFKDLLEQGIENLNNAKADAESARQSAEEAKKNADEIKAKVPDQNMSDLSENSVQNKVIKKYVDSQSLIFDGIDNNVFERNMSYTSDSYAVGAIVSKTSIDKCACSEISVNEGEKYFLLSVKHVENTFPFLAVDSQNKLVKIFNDYSALEKGYVYTVEKGISKILTNIPMTPEQMIQAPIKITEKTFTDKRFSNIRKKFVANEPYKKEENIIYSNIFWGEKSLQLTDAFFYHVKPHEKVHFSFKIYDDKQFAEYIYLNEKGNIVSIAKHPQKLDVDITMKVPPFAKTLLLCTQKYQNPVFEVEKYDFSNESNYKMSVSYSKDSLLVKNLKNGNYLNWEHFGGNNLFMIHNYRVAGQKVETYSDMTPAPYIVKAVENIDGDDDSMTYTGGNHQYNNQGSGSTPTARQIDLQILADDKIVNIDDTVNCDKLTIIETNRVQGWNTKKSDGTGREILEETIQFEFDGKELQVFNTIKPLENVVIQTYYGIQTCLFKNSDYIVYADKTYNVDTVTQCPEKPYAIKANSLVVSKMKDCGIGNYLLNTSSEKARISYNKSYFVPINWNSKQTNVGDELYMVGSYIFDENVQVN